MSIITISRSFCSKGGYIAEQVAKELGYECISREILIEASEQFNIPEIKLARAIHDGPSFFDKFRPTKEKYISYIRAALLEHLQKGNIVYHGLAGHFFLQSIPCIFKIRTLSDMEDRINEEMERHNTSYTVAQKQLMNDDKERLNWSMYMYKMDTSDPELYDMVLNLKNMSISDCVHIIVKTAELEQFQLTDEVRARLKDEALSANIKASIIEDYSDTSVTSSSGKVLISLNTPVSDLQKTKDTITNFVENISGVQSVSVNLMSNTLSRTAMHK